MGDEDHCRLTAREKLIQQVHTVGSDNRVERRCRFIENDQVRFSEQSHGNNKALLHPPAPAPRPFSQISVFNLERSKKLLSPVFVMRQPQGGFRFLPVKCHRTQRIECFIRALWDVRYGMSLRLQVIDQGMPKRRLAGPGRPDKTQARARIDIK